jgi:hypothetical protein
MDKAASFEIATPENPGDRNIHPEFTAFSCRSGCGVGASACPRIISRADSRLVDRSIIRASKFDSKIRAKTPRVEFFRFDDLRAGQFFEIKLMRWQR